MRRMFSALLAIVALLLVCPPARAYEKGDYQWRLAVGSGAGIAAPCNPFGRTSTECPSTTGTVGTVSVGFNERRRGVNISSRAGRYGQPLEGWWGNVELTSRMFSIGPVGIGLAGMVEQEEYQIPFQSDTGIQIGTSHHMQAMFYGLRFGVRLSKDASIFSNVTYGNWESNYRTTLASQDFSGTYDLDHHLSNLGRVRVGIESLHLNKNISMDVAAQRTWGYGRSGRSAYSPGTSAGQTTGLADISMTAWRPTKTLSLDIVLHATITDKRNPITDQRRIWVATVFRLH